MATTDNIGSRLPGVLAPARTRPAHAADAGARFDAPLLALVGLTVLAAGLRFALIGHQGYWLDEGITLQVLHLPFGESLHAVRFRESTPPLYYVVGWGWIRVFGFGEAGARSLSAVAGTAVVPVAYAIGARLGSRRVGLLAAAFTACSPLLVWYSQEARPYSLLVLLSALSLLAFLRACERPEPARFLLWGLLSALAVLDHYFAFVLIAPQVAWLVFKFWRSWAMWAAVVLIGAVGGALIPLAVAQQGLTRWISGDPLSIRLHQLVFQFPLGFAIPAAEVLKWVALAALVLAVALLAWRGDRKAIRSAGAMAALAAAGFAFALILIAFGHDIINTRNLLELWLPVAVVVALGLGVRGAGPLGLAGALVLCAIGISGVVFIDSHPSLQRPNWRSMAREVGPPLTGGARVIMILRGSPYPFVLYRSDFSLQVPKVIKQVKEVDMLYASHAPDIRACWWGAACSLRVTRLDHPPKLPGFIVAGEIRKGYFTMVRLRAPFARPVTQAALVRSVPILSLGLHRLVIQPGRG